MEVKEIYELMESVAPVALSDEYCKKYGAYDNSGLIVNCDRPVKGVLFSLDFSMKAVNESRERGFNVIVTHHPAIFGGISRLDAANDPLAAALGDCFKRGVSVISMHLNLDTAPEGIDHQLMRAFGGTDPAIMQPLSSGGYGRAYAVSPVTLSELSDRLRRVFSSARTRYYGDKTKRIRKVASFCGAGCGEDSLAFAVREGAELFVSSDMKHHQIAELLARGINVVELTHYAAEYYGFNKICTGIIEKLKVPAAIFCDGELM